jgi:hypothetical protein
MNFFVHKIEADKNNKAGDTTIANNTPDGSIL